MYSFGDPNEYEEITFDDGTKMKMRPIVCSLWADANFLYGYSLYEGEDNNFSSEFRNDGKTSYSATLYLDFFRYDVSPIVGNIRPIKRNSIAYKLQPSISKWYKGLRLIATVGLLCVIVYIGILIIINSASAQNKAKYKAMLKDWIMALCMLFILHYIMAFMLNFSEGLIDIIDNISATNVEGNTTDDLMNSIRDAARDGMTNASKGDNSIAIENAHILIYIVIVLLTLTFTFQYLKRVIFMAFLTIIAPLIALTYPIDKVKDGKAQAYSFWLKEYIVNCLIQPVHLLLYTVFVTSASGLAAKNVLFSIVALAFLIPAEKLIREMFGLKAQTSTGGAMGAFAGGALLGGLLGKLKGLGGGKEKEESSEEQKPTKTKTRTKDSSQSNNENSKDGGKPLEGNKGKTSNSGSTGKSGDGKNKDASSKKNISGPKKILSAGGKFAKNVATTAGGVMMAGAAGMASLAANIADGDLFENPSKALGEIGGSAAVGYGAGKAFTNKALTGSSSLYQKLKQARKK